MKDYLNRRESLENHTTFLQSGENYSFENIDAMILLISLALKKLESEKGPYLQTELLSSSIFYSHHHRGCEQELRFRSLASISRIRDTPVRYVSCKES